MAFKVSMAASLAISILSDFVSAGVVPLLPRDDYASQAPCSYPFTPFDYVGCYVDISIPTRSLIWSPNLDFGSMTVEKCVAACKGILPPTTLVVGTTC